MARTRTGEAAERRRARAVEIGNAPFEHAAYAEAVTLLSDDAAAVRRAAASAISKLLDETPNLADLAFLPLHAAVLRETHGQVLQYMLRALGKCARRLTPPIVADIADIARNPANPPYVRTAANEAAAAGEAALRMAEALHRHWCSRCKTPLDAEQAGRSIQRYGKPYCRHCQDERELEDKNFEREVEASKRLRTVDRVAVQSQGEKRIGDWLAAHHVEYVYDERYRIAGDVSIRPDFYLPEFDLYVEYWGMDTRDYLARKCEKRFLYQRAGKKLISLDYHDLDRIEDILAEKLSRYFRL